MLYKAKNHDSSSSFLSFKFIPHMPYEISRKVAFNDSLSFIYFIEFFYFECIYSVTIQPQCLIIPWFLQQFSLNVYLSHDLLHSLTFHNISPTLCLADSKLPIIYAWDKWNRITIIGQEYYWEKNRRYILKYLTGKPLHKKPRYLYLCYS